MKKRTILLYARGTCYALDGFDFIGYLREVRGRVDGDKADFYRCNIVERNDNTLRYVCETTGKK